MVGIYARVSTVKQKDNYSLGVQKKQGIEFAKSLNMEYRIFEEAESGSSMISRVELERLLSDIKEGFIKKVWAIEFTRISRSVEDLQVIKRIFNEHNTELYINGSLCDLTMPDQRFIFNINAAVSEYERERIVERVKRGLAERKDQGIIHSPQIYGYERKYDEDGNPRHVIIEAEAEVIQFVFNNRKRGWSLRRISRHLNDNHIPTKLGNRWTRRGVLNILGHFIYTGNTTQTDGTVIYSLIYPEIIPLYQFNRLWNTSYKVSKVRPIMAY